MTIENNPLDIVIINKLLDKYENSVLFKESNKNKLNIYLNANDKIFINYWSNVAYRYRDEYNFYLKKLEDQSLIQIKYKDNLIDKIFLNFKNIDKAYLYCNRENKNTIYDRCLNVVSNYQNLEKSKVLEGFLSKIKEILINKQSFKKYFTDLNELEYLIKGIDQIENNKEEQFLRNFSNKTFSDSKYLEKHVSKFISIFNEFGNYDFLNETEFINYFNIYKIPTFTYIKGNALIKINGQIIDLNSLGDSFSLTRNEITKLEFININSKKILTIENLTTFFYFNDPSFFIVYLGGFASSNQLFLLEKIKKLNNNFEYFHFGDIDCNGINILIDLEKRTKLSIRPLYMDENILLKYTNQTEKLTVNDRKRLENYLNNNEYKRFHELIRLMLEKNIKLEQESIEKF